MMSAIIDDLVDCMSMFYLLDVVRNMDPYVVVAEKTITFVKTYVFLTSQLI